MFPRYGTEGAEAAEQGKQRRNQCPHDHVILLPLLLPFGTITVRLRRLLWDWFNSYTTRTPCNSLIDSLTSTNHCVSHFASLIHAFYDGEKEEKTYVLPVSFLLQSQSGKRGNGNEHLWHLKKLQNVRGGMTDNFLIIFCNFLGKERRRRSREKQERKIWSRRAHSEHSCLKKERTATRKMIWVKDEGKNSNERVMKPDGNKRLFDLIWKDGILFFPFFSSSFSWSILKGGRMVVVSECRVCVCLGNSLMIQAMAPLWIISHFKWEWERRDRVDSLNQSNIKFSRKNEGRKRKERKREWSLSPSRFDSRHINREIYLYSLYQNTE